MVAPHPSIAWQMHKTPETLRFVEEASLAYFTRSDFREGEREKLRQEIEKLVSGEESLVVGTDMNDWFTKERSPEQMRESAPLPYTWQMGKTTATIDFVNEAEAALMSGIDMNEAEKHTLRTMIELLKKGLSSLGEKETVEAWLEQLRDHHP